MTNEEILRKTALFTKIEKDKFSLLISQISEVKVPANEVFIKEGDKADALYIVKEGVLQVFTHGKTGEEVVLARLEKGDFVGEQALLTTNPGFRNASVRTLSECVLLRIGHATFQTVIEAEDPIRKELEKLGYRQLISKLRAVETECDISKFLLEKDISQYETKEFNPGDKIITEGQPPGGVYFLLSGLLEVYKRNEEGVNELISTMGPNNLFGETSIILGRPRQATIVVREKAKAFYISPTKFRELYQTHPDLKKVANTLIHVYQSPVRGNIRQYMGTFLHMPAVVTKFHLKDGRELTSNIVIGKNIQSIRELNIKDPQILTHESKIFYRELHLADKRLVGIVAYGEWGAVKELYTRVFEGKDLSDIEIQAFTDSGDIKTVPSEKGESSEEIICNCLCISRGVINQCMNAGCTSFEEVSEKTRAGTVCGGCIPTILSMFGHKNWQAMHIQMLEQFSPDIRTYKLFPVQKKALSAFKSGQHVVIQCEVGDKWLERTYTLTSTPGNLEYYEIAIKKEENGQLSEWLFDNDEHIPFVRVSNPTGILHLDTSHETKLVCFTAGIGVTPAVSFARTVTELNYPRPLSIYLTGKRKELLPYDKELESLAGKSPKIQYFKHLTEEKGRMKPEDVVKIAKEDLTVDFFICGPKEFMNMVKTALLSAGVKKEKIFTEKFSHAAGPAVDSY